MSRRFGPTLAAGTVIIEEDPEQGILPAPTGTVSFIGILEKGDPDEVIECNTLNDYVRKCGGYLDGTEVPDNVLDFFRLSNGGGRAFLIRVTDGLETKSADKVFDRNTGRGEYYTRDAGTTHKGVMVSVSAKNGGRWGGAEKILRVDGWTIATDLTETTLDLGVTLLENELAGVTLQLIGVTTQSYEVVSNTTAGVVTAKSDSTMATDLAGGGDPTNNDAVLYLDNETRTFNAPGSVSGARKELGLVWKDGAEDPDAYFGLDITLDGTIVRSYPNLSLDSANKWYITNVINLDPSNDYITITVDHSGSITSANRPSDWYGTYKAYSGGTLTAQVVRVSSVASTNGDVGFATDFVSPTKLVRSRITLTFTSASAFDVATDADYGMTVSGLAAGAVGTPYAPGDDFLPGFTIKDGVDAFSIGDVITLDVDPFPVDLSTADGTLLGWVYTNAGSDKTRTGIDSNTENTITLKNTPSAAPSPDGLISAKSSADTTIGTAISFPFTEAVTLDYVDDIDGIVQINIASATYATITELVTALNGEQTTGTRATFFAESTTVPDALAIVHATVASTNTGEEAFFRAVTGSADVNITEDTWVLGDVGDEFRVEAPRTLRAGYDGSTPADSDFTKHFNTATSVLNRLQGRNVGLVKMATPGVTTTAIQKAGLAYASARNYQYRVETPSSITDEASANAHINDTIGRNNYGVNTWPSYMYVVNPIGSGQVLQSISGAIFGREAAVARDFGGYHKAAAGTSVTLPHVVDSPLGEAVVNEEVTNPQGVNIVKKIKGNWVLWGDRTISIDPGWMWKHQREYMSHTELVLSENFDWLIFAINDEQERRKLDPVFRAYFLPEWQKRAVRGATFDEAVSIKIDAENNTNATMAAGDMHAAIGLRLADTVERFIITIGKKGIFDQAA